MKSQLLDASQDLLPLPAPSSPLFLALSLSGPLFLCFLQGNLKQLQCSDLVCWQWRSARSVRTPLTPEGSKCCHVPGLEHQTDRPFPNFLCRCSQEEPQPETPTTLHWVKLGLGWLGHETSRRPSPIAGDTQGSCSAEMAATGSYAHCSICQSLLGGRGKGEDYICPTLPGMILPRPTTPSHHLPHNFAVTPSKLAPVLVVHKHCSD